MSSGDSEFKLNLLTEQAFTFDFVCVLYKIQKPVIAILLCRPTVSQLQPGFSKIKYFPSQTIAFIICQLKKKIKLYSFWY